MSTERALQAILHDKVSGSQDLTRKSASLILQILRQDNGPSPQCLTKELTQVGDRLIQAQPVMASLANLLNTVLMALEGDGASLSNARSAVKAFTHGLTVTNEAISRHLNRLLRTNDVILTYSGSRTVWEALAWCWKKGKRFSVICSESRPACEGLLLARRLTASGIPTSLATEAMAFSLLTSSRSKPAKVTKVLVGADLISPQGFTNKTGTHPLAEIARQGSMPFYVMAGKEKFFAAKLPLARMIRDAPAQEVLPRPPRKLKVIHQTFDVTPLSRVTGIITDQGLLSPLECKKILKRVELHPAIRTTYRKIELRKVS